MSACAKGGDWARCLALLQESGGLQPAASGSLVDRLNGTSVLVQHALSAALARLTLHICQHGLQTGVKDILVAVVVVGVGVGVG
eukprot:12077487-Alexandrium_andersonii.AAC.1